MQKKSKTEQIREACDPSHYKEGPVETIEILESIVDSKERNLTPKQKFSVAQAVRYLLRAGLKGGPEDAAKDLQKAENYIHRAAWGDWIGREFMGGEE